MIIACVVLIEIILLILTIVSIYWYEDTYKFRYGVIGWILIAALVITPFAVGSLHGYINYIESNDKDKARIVAVTQEQDLFKAYYKIEVEYLTNTPTQDGLVTNYNIEKDTFYCYIEDKDLVRKLKDNMYKELWIISGYKGGYETYKDFGTKLIKDIQLLEE